VQGQAAHVTGAATFEQPSISLHSCPGNIWADWSTQLLDPTLCMDRSAQLNEDGTRLGFGMENHCEKGQVEFQWRFWDATGFKMADHGHYLANDFLHDWWVVAAGSNDLIVHWKGVAQGPLDAKYFSDNHSADSIVSGEETIDGVFHRDGAPPSTLHPIKPKSGGHLPMSGALAFLSMLLAYLAMAIPSTIRDGKSSERMSIAGLVIGVTELFKEVPALRWLAGQAKLAGFATGALAEALEIARTYEKSVATGESGPRTSTRIAISVIPDVAAFAASSLVVEAGMGVFATAAAMLGSPIAAGIIAGAGVAVLSYGISVAATSVKETANKLIDQW
jgi:hypothetical protein